MMKKLISVLLIFVMVGALCACGESPKVGVFQKYLDVVGVGEVEMMSALGGGKQNVATIDGKQSVISHDYAENYNNVSVNVSVAVKLGKVTGVYFYPAQNGFDSWAAFIAQNIGKGPSKQTDNKYIYNLGSGYVLNLVKNSTTTAFEIIQK